MKKAESFDENQAQNELKKGYKKAEILLHDENKLEIFLQKIENKLTIVPIVGNALSYIPVMISRDCPMAYVKNCKDDNSCKTCNFANGYSLLDRMGKSFRMERKNGFTNIYNSLPIMSIESLPKIQKAGVTNFRLDFTFEKDIREIQKIYYDFLYNIIDEEEVKEFMKEYKKTHEVTNGHFFRGVL